MRLSDGFYDREVVETDWCDAQYWIPSSDEHHIGLTIGKPYRICTDHVEEEDFIMEMGTIWFSPDMLCDGKAYKFARTLQEDIKHDPEVRNKWLSVFKGQ